MAFFQGKENTEKHVEEGQVVMVTEHRIFDGGNRKGQIVIRVSVTWLDLTWLNPLGSLGNIGPQRVSVQN